MSKTAARLGGRPLLAALLLLGVTAIWGSTFAISKNLLTRMAVLDYLALRFLLAALVVGLARPAVLLRAGWRVVALGVLLGLVYSAGQLLMHVGLQRTAPTVSAFVVSMYVVFTPLLAAALNRRWPTRRTVLATLLATGGVAAMSLRGLALGWGELLTLIAAALFAVHITALGRWARAETAYALAVVQLATMGIAFLAIASIDGTQLPQRADWPAFLYLALLAGGLAMLVQTWAQAHLAAAIVAILMVLEPVWAAVFGLALFGESLDRRVLIGAGLILLGLLVTASGTRRARVGAPDPSVDPIALGGYAVAGSELAAPPASPADGCVTGAVDHHVTEGAIGADRRLTEPQQRASPGPAGQRGSRHTRVAGNRPVADRPVRGSERRPVDPRSGVPSSCATRPGGGTVVVLGSRQERRSRRPPG